MTEEESQIETRRGGLNAKLTLSICLLILLAAAGVTAVIFSTEPVAQRETATRTSAMLVETVEVRRGDYRPVVVETGVVRPAREIEISSQVQGLIVETHPEFAPGGLIEKGEALAKIEPDDYRHALRRRESELTQAKSDLKLEMGRQEIARQDFQLFEDAIAQKDASLALREPQLVSAKVRVDAAQAAVDQAKLDLARTAIRSPFNAQILSRSANLGSQVSQGTPLARLVGVDTYWVMATVPLKKIPYLAFRDDNDRKGAPVELRNRSAWPDGVARSGRLYKLAGALEPDTRLARVVIEVDDPLAQSTESEGLPSLLIGEYLEVRIQGKTIDNVVRLDRRYLRNNDTAWVMDAESKLRIRPLKVAFKDAENAYVREGLEDGERVVATHLSTVTDGAPLRRQGSDEPVQPEQPEPPDSEEGKRE